MELTNQNPFYFKVLYNGKDISQDISQHLKDFTYTDNISGTADDLEINLEDVDGKWSNTWYPQKGAVLVISFGYTAQVLNPNPLEIDEIEVTGSKGGGDVVRLKAIAAGVNKALHTKRSHAHENKTLGEIVRTVAAAHGLTIIGNIANITIGRVTQYQQTDMSFLARLAAEYGYYFTIKGNKLSFVHYKDLDDIPKALSLDKTDCISYNIRDKSSQVYNKANVRSTNPYTNKTVTGTASVTTETNNDGKQYQFLGTADNSLEIRTKTENQNQASIKAEAALHFVNSLQQTASITVPGNVILLAGNNIELTGFGVLSGIWNILKAKHSYNKSSGYQTSCDLKRIIPSTLSGSTKTPKLAKYTAPVYTTLTNRDGKSFDFLSTK